MNYYNDIDPQVCLWLQELISAGLIPSGKVDCRPIQEITARDLEGFVQHHFFCGVAGWSLALQRAGWPADRPIWTGSCPCQPFSAAGKRKGKKDARHVWPEFYRLIRECRPSIVLGEQVASKDGLEWLDGVSSDLEASDYTVRSADLCSAGVGAPHIRQRLYWLAYSQCNAGRSGWIADEPRKGSPTARAGAPVESGRCGLLGATDGGLANVRGAGSQERGEHQGPDERQAIERGLPSGGLVVTNGDGRESWNPSSSIDGYGSSFGSAGGNEWLEYSEGVRREPWRTQPERRSAECRCGAGGLGNPESNDQRRSRLSGVGERRPSTSGGSGAWGDYYLVHCRDGKARRIESGSQPLVAGLPAGMVPSGDPSLQEVQATAEARKMRLSGYGNALTVEVAVQFILCAMDEIEDVPI